MGTNKKISEEDVRNPVDGSEEVRLAKGGRNYKATLQAIISAISGGSGGTDRTLLTADRTYYVSPTGNDNNDGLTGGAAWLTLQHACTYIAQNIDFAGFNITISIAPGTYDGFAIPYLYSSVVNPPYSFGAGLLIFDGGTYTDVIVGLDAASGGSCILSMTPTSIVPIITNMTVDCRSIPQGAAIYTAFSMFAIGTGAGGTVRFLGDPTHVHNSGEHIACQYNSIMLLCDNIIIDGGLWDYGMRADSGDIQLANAPIGPSNSLTYTMVNTPNFAANFAIVGNQLGGGRIQDVTGATFVGAALGGGFDVFPGCTIDVSVGGGGLNFFPGNSPGNVRDGGQYVYKRSDGSVHVLSNEREVLTADRTYYVTVLSGTIAGGSSYTSGTYGGKKGTVPLTGGSGSGATAKIVVSGGAVTAVMPSSQGNGNYQIGDVLSAAAVNIGGTGSGFTFTITGIGSDANDGLTAAAPMLRAQTAYNLIAETLDTARFPVTIQMADGIYLASLTAPVGAGFAIFRFGQPWVGGGQVLWQGNLNDQTRVVIYNDGLFGSTQSVPLSALDFILYFGDPNETGGGPTLPNAATGQFMTFISAAGGGGTGMVAAAVVGSINVINVDFDTTGTATDGTSSSTHPDWDFAVFNPGATLSVVGDYTLTGNRHFGHMAADYSGSIISYFPGTITASGTVNCPIFAKATLDSQIVGWSGNFVGTFTGKRFDVSDGVIDVSQAGGGLTFFPGDVEGTISGGGRYIT